MADQKISELTALTGANLAEGDAFAVVDTSAVQTKKITYGELKAALDTGTGFVRITGDTMTGNLGINATPTQRLHVGGNAIITGITRLGNGTATSPAYQFVDDTNTGMYRSSSDVLGFSTGGGNRLTLNSTGATFAGSVIAPTLQTTAGGTVTTASGNDLNIVYPSTRSLFFKEGSTTTLTLDNAQNATFGGNIIGSDELQLLQPNGANNFGMELNNSHQIKYKARGSSGTHIFTNTTSDTERARLDASGNLGIGTTSPSANVEIYDTQNTQLRVNTASHGYLDLSNYANGAGVMTSAAHPLRLGTANIERMRIDSSGRVGINRTPSISNSKLEVGGADNVSIINVEASGVTGGMGIGSTGLQFFHGSTAHMRITSSGRVGIGTSAPDATFTVTSAAEPIAKFHQTATGDVSAVIMQHGRAASSTSAQMVAFLNGAGTLVGSINLTGSATEYATSSDYRLKENVDYSWDATTRLKQLKPARFNFISDDTNTLVDGFIAHEVSSIVPESITGTKDAVDADNNPVYQGIDQSKLVPLLVKTIQELEARITALEA